MRLAIAYCLILFTIGCGGPSETKATFTAGSSPPAIASLAPDSAPVGSVALTMVVTGKNFINGALVFWNGVPLSTSFVNSEELLVSVTQTDLQFAGSAQVYVRTSGVSSNTLDFSVVP